MGEHKKFKFSIDFDVASTCILILKDQLVKVNSKFYKMLLLKFTYKKKADNDFFILGGILMELQTISQVSKYFSISTRTLRYYEQIGLITPAEKEDFTYRVYDMEAITRLRQIIFLRKLRIPLKQIAEILKKRGCERCN